jgi:hypothetical protein
MCTDAHREALMRHLSSTASPAPVTVPTPVTVAVPVPDQRVAEAAAELARFDSTAEYDHTLDAVMARLADVRRVLPAGA